jgi:outer membrane protein TolC
MFQRLITAAVALALAVPAAGQRSTAAVPVLDLQAALSLAHSDQPRLLAFEREADASQQAAVAARSLPDPQVSIGVQNFPVTGMNALSPTEDEMTMLTIGVMREQVRRSKRKAEAEKILAEALVSRRQATAEERRIRREVMLAWIDAVEARAKQKLLRTLISDLRTGRKVAEAGISTGSSTSATALQADADIAFAEALLAQASGDEGRARADLARWIGAAADRPLPDALPRIELPASYGERLNAVGQHPELDVARAEQTLAAREIESARQDRKPDISWSVMLGFRPNYGEMVGGTVSIPLQMNRGNRQDRLVAAAQARADAAALRLQDQARELERAYRGAVANYRGAEAEIARIDKDAVPALEAAFTAAEARYEAGGGTLDQPFAIVRRYSDAGIQSIEAHARRERAAAEIVYILGETGQ